MHELLIGVEELPPRIERGNTRYRPAGRVLFAATLACKRNKWAEILCDLADPRPRRRLDGAFDPSKRAFYEGAQTPIQESLGAHWDLIKEQWTPEARGRWFECECIPQGHMEKPIAEAFLWSEIEKTGIRTALGKDPTGLVDLLDTWLWSEHERKTHLVVVNADMSEVEAEAATVIKVENYGEGEEKKSFHYPSAVIKWSSDLGLSELEKVEILDKGTIYQPRFDRLAGKTVVKKNARPIEAIESAVGIEVKR